ncbi:mCG1042483, partial [Mus musculus]
STFPLGHCKYLFVYGCNSAIYSSKYLLWFLFRSQTSFFLDNGKFLCRAVT